MTCNICQARLLDNLQQRVLGYFVYLELFTSSEKESNELLLHVALWRPCIPRIIHSIQLGCSASSRVAAESICEKMELKIIHIRLVTGSASNRLVAIQLSKCSLCCEDNKTKEKEKQKRNHNFLIFFIKQFWLPCGMCFSKKYWNQRYQKTQGHSHITLHDHPRGWATF